MLFRKYGYFKDFQYKMCLSYFALVLFDAYFHVCLFHVCSVGNSKSNSHRNERKDNKVIWCFQTFDW